MSGLAHGNSGILIPILALSKYTERTMYEEIADKIWNYENSLYDPAINNWKDTREQGKVVSSDNIGAVAWCHGVAGLCIPEFYVMSLQRIKNGKIDWN